jgi:rare lipoprotein A
MPSRLRDSVRVGLFPTLLLTMLLASACVARRAPSTKPPAAHTETGMASWYGERFHGRRTASGEIFDMHALTAAHRTLAFGSIVRVTEIQSGKSVDVRINDRGPSSGARIIDLSHAAAHKLGMLRRGVARVELTVIDRRRG